MALKQSNIDLRNKITQGITKAVQKLIERRAAENSTLVVVVDGKPMEVPARQLLKK